MRRGQRPVPSAKKSVASKNRKHSENLKSITSEQDKSVVGIRRFLLYKENHRRCRWFPKALAMSSKNILGVSLRDGLADFRYAQNKVTMIYLNVIVSH